MGMTTVPQDTNLIGRELSLDELDQAVGSGSRGHFHRANLDGMSELGEMESLRLQMAMDRMSKMMSTLSNLLGKISNTGDQITRNIK